MIKIKRVFILLTMMTEAILLITGGCKKDNTPAQTTSYDLMVKLVNL